MRRTHINCLAGAGLVMAAALVIMACKPAERAPNAERTVTVYVSTDRVFSEPVLREYERWSGVRVNAVYDTEETKSTGLANRLLAEINRPRADVFWSNEPVRTLVLKARVRKRFKVTTISDPDQPVAGNVLDRQFAAARPNQCGVSDTTEFVIGSSAKLYLAAILDLYSRFVVGWAVSAVNDRHLTIRAREMALKRRCPQAGLLHHSDQGSPYASEDYQRLLGAHGIACSMSNCYDNAVVESWGSTVKSELGERFESCGEAKRELFDYIEVFYNPRRRHSTLGHVSPAAFERQAEMRQVA